MQFAEGNVSEGLTHLGAQGRLPGEVVSEPRSIGWWGLAWQREGDRETSRCWGEGTGGLRCRC